MTPTAPARSDDVSPRLDLAVSDVRQHVYCPRIPFFRLGARLPHRFVTVAMQEGILEHQRTEALEQRRSLRAYGLTDGEREFDVRLRSERLALGGRVDMVIRRLSEVIPVEFKNTRAGLGLHHKYQLAAYARRRCARTRGGCSTRSDRACSVSGYRAARGCSAAAACVSSCRIATIAGSARVDMG